MARVNVDDNESGSLLPMRATGGGSTRGSPPIAVKNVNIGDVQMGHVAGILDLFTQLSVLLDASTVRDMRDRFENEITEAVQKVSLEFQEAKKEFARLYEQFQDGRSHLRTSPCSTVRWRVCEEISRGIPTSSSS